MCVCVCERGLKTDPEPTRLIPNLCFLVTEGEVDIVHITFTLTNEPLGTATDYLKETKKEKTFTKITPRPLSMMNPDICNT